MNLLEIGIVLTAIDRMSGVIGGATNRAVQSFTRLQDKVAQVGRAMTEMGTKASLMGHGILAGLETPIKAFADLDEASTNLRVAMMNNLGQVPPQFAEINRQAIELGNILPGTTADFVNTARALIENGTALETIIGGGLKAASYLGVILQLPQAGAAEMVAKFREAFGLTENELVKMADLTQRAKFAFGLNPEEIKYAAQYAGSTLNNLKLTGIENTKAFLAMQGIARQKGMEGSVFGTNFASMLNNIGMMKQKLARNSKIMREVNADLKKAGIHMQFFDKAGKFVGLEKMVGELEKLKVLSEQDKLNVMNKIFGMEGGRVASMLSDAGVTGLHDYMDRMQRQADLQKRIEEITKSAKNTWEALTGTVTNFWAAVGGPMVTSLYPLIHKLNDLTGGPLMDWVAANKDMVKWLGLTALGAGVLLVALGGLGIVAGAVVSGLAAVGSAVAILTGPIGVAVAAIAAGTALIVANWGTLSAFFRGLWHGLLAGLAPLKSLGSQLAAGLSPLLAIGRALYYVFLRPFVELYRWLSRIAAPIAQSAVAMQAFGYRVGRGIATAITWVAGLYQSAVDFPGKVMAAVSQAVSGGLSATMQAVSRAASAASEIGGKILATFRELPGKLFDAGAAMLDMLIAGIKSKIGAVVSTVSGLTERIRGFFNRSPAKEGALRDIHQHPFSEMVAKAIRPEPVVNAVRAMTTAAALAMAPLTQATLAAAHPVPATIAEASDTLGARVASLSVNLAADMVTAGAKILTSLWEGMKSVSGNVLDWVGQFAGKIMDHFPRSPAKTGPFRDIPNIHIIESIAATMRPEPLVRAASAAAAAGMLALSPLAAAANQIPLAQSATTISSALEAQTGSIFWANPAMPAMPNRLPSLPAPTTPRINRLPPMPTPSIPRITDRAAPVAQILSALPRPGSPTLDMEPLQGALRTLVRTRTAGMVEPIMPAIVNRLPPMPAPVAPILANAAAIPSPVAMAKPVPRLAPVVTAPAAGQRGQGAGGPVTVHFSPTINVQGGQGGGRDTIMAALKTHEHELIQLIEQVMARNARRQY